MKGYIVNNENQKIICLIKVNWMDNPEQFRYKLSENDKTEKGTIEEIKEFGVNDYLKYIRATVGIDRSSNDIDDVDYERTPTLKPETLFLKVLVEGKANLYSYDDGSLNKYFFNQDSADIEPLIYKRYKTSNNHFSENKRYRNQLWNHLKCPSLGMSPFEDLNYKKKDLTKIFSAYNECQNQPSENYVEKQKKDIINVNIRPGLNRSSLLLNNNTTYPRVVEFDDKLSFRIGMEIEFLIPFHKNQAAILFEPTYQYYKTEKELIWQMINVEYNSIELPIGLRYYFKVSDKFLPFINGLYICDLITKSEVNVESGSQLELKSWNNFAFGLGAKSIKYSFEFRYQTVRILGTGGHALRDSEYSSLSVVLGYSLSKN